MIRKFINFCKNHGCLGLLFIWLVFPYAFGLLFYYGLLLLVTLAGGIVAGAFISIFVGLRNYFRALKHAVKS